MQKLQNHFLKMFKNRIVLTNYVENLGKRHYLCILF